MHNQGHTLGNLLQSHAHEMSAFCGKHSFWALRARIDSAVWIFIVIITINIFIKIIKIIKIIEIIIVINILVNIIYRLILNEVIAEFMKYNQLLVVLSKGANNFVCVISTVLS